MAEERKVLTPRQFARYKKRLENLKGIRANIVGAISNALNISTVEERRERRKRIRQTEIQICDDISGYDLSQIPPEMFYDFKNLEDVNLEGTGARLDMANFKANTFVNGSIKGCELISYNGNNYIIKRKGFMSLDACLTAKTCDVEQYQAILDYYNTNDRIKEFYLGELEFIIHNSEIQKNNRDFFDRLYRKEKEMHNYSNISKVWSIMTAETQKQNMDYFDVEIENPEYLIRITKDDSIIREKMPEIIEHYKTSSERRLDEFFTKWSQTFKRRT